MFEKQDRVGWAGSARRFARCSSLAVALGGGLVFSSEAMAAGCPVVANLPLFSIDEIDDDVIPTVERWQVLWHGAAVSDAQLAIWAEDAPLLRTVRDEAEKRGRWTFVGLGLAASGTAISSAGWLLFGQNELSRGITLPMAMGGVLIGLAGVLLMVDSVHRPLEAFMTPVPNHRLTRDEARRLVVEANHRLVAEVCRTASSEATSPKATSFEATP